MPPPFSPQLIDVDNDEVPQDQPRYSYIHVATQVLSKTKNDYSGPPSNLQVPPQVVQPSMKYLYQGIQSINPGTPLVHPREPYAHAYPQYVYPGVPYAPNVHSGAPYAQASNLWGHIANHGMTNVRHGTLIRPQVSIPQGTQFPPQGPQYACHNSSYMNMNKPVDYQLLDERIRAIGKFSYYGVDAKELCLVPNVVLPHKFKVSDLQKYKGLRILKNHITMYCKKMAFYIDNDGLLIHCFQDSLSGASLDWYMGLECSKIRSWQDLFDAFLKQYKYVLDMDPVAVNS